jgi:hypothetical protein
MASVFGAFSLFQQKSTEMSQQTINITAAAGNSHHRPLPHLEVG